MTKDEKQLIGKRFNVDERKYRRICNKLIKAIVEEYDLLSEIEENEEGEQYIGKLNNIKLDTYKRSTNSVDRSISKEIINAIEAATGENIEGIIKNSTELLLTSNYLKDLKEVSKRISRTNYEDEPSSYRENISLEEHELIEEYTEIALEVSNEKAKVKEIKEYLKKYEKEKLDWINENIAILEKLNYINNMFDIIDIHENLKDIYECDINFIQLLPDIKKDDEYYKLLEGFKEQDRVDRDINVNIDELADKINDKVCRDINDKDMYKVIDYIVKCNYEDTENIFKLLYLNEKENDKYNLLVNIINNIIDFVGETKIEGEE